MLQVVGEKNRCHAAVAELALDTVSVGQRRLEAVQQLGDQAAPEEVPGYIRAGTAQQLEQPTDSFRGTCGVSSVVSFVLLPVVSALPRHDTDTQNIA
jgi:hypothetical protein